MKIDEYLEVSKQAFKLGSRKQQKCWDFSEDCVETANELKLRPHGRGDILAHYQGFVAEAYFEAFLLDNFIEHVELCREMFPEKRVRKVHHDFMVMNSGRFELADVKSGVLPAGMSFDVVPIESYGLTVPVVQVQSDTMIYPHVFLHLNGNVVEGVFVGWAWRWQVVRDGEEPRRINPGVGGRPDYYKVPVCELHSPRELFQLSRKQEVVEDVEKILA